MNELNFFVGSTDYLAHLRQTDQAEPVIEALEREWRGECGKLAELEGRTLAGKKNLPRTC
jgi:hypothetical protein